MDQHLIQRDADTASHFRLQKPEITKRQADEPLSRG